MANKKTSPQTHLNPEACASVAKRILQKWGMADTDIEKVLRLRPAVETEANEYDSIKRVACILNIHAALRTIFNNPDNVYGFMNMTNNNPFFDGRKPMDIISSGHLEDLEQVELRITSMLRLW